jgi:hypothetical protein
MDRTGIGTHGRAARARVGVLLACVVVAASAGLCGSASAASTIDTSASWDGATAIAPFGQPDTPTYGETVTVPGGDRFLTSFTFYLNLPDTLTFRAEVYAWDGTKATGPALYESAPMHTGGSAAFEATTFGTGSLELTAGAQYILFASVSRDYAASSGTGSWGAFASDTVYDGGGFHYDSDGGDPAKWVAASWDGFGVQPRDLAFQAMFTDGSKPAAPPDPPAPAPPTVTVASAPPPAAPVPAPAPAPASAPTLVAPFAGMTLRPQALRAGSGGKVPLSLACPPAALGRCAGTVALEAGRVTLGSSTFSVAAGAAARVTVRLSRRARTLLAARRRLTVTEVAVAHDSRNLARSSRARVALRGARR